MLIGDSLAKLSFDEWYELTLEEIERVEKQ
jgi:hypothetical protein